MSNTHENQDIKGGFGPNFITLGKDRIEFNGNSLKSFTTEGAILRIANNIPKTSGVTFSADHRYVLVNGVKIERAQDGKIIVTGPPGITLKDYHAVTPGEDMRPGEKREDGTIYLGLFRTQKDDGEPVCKDAFVSASSLRTPDGQVAEQHPVVMAEQTKRYRAHGYTDWVLGNADVLKEQFKHRMTGHFDGTYREIGHRVRDSIYMGAPTKQDNGQVMVPIQSFYDNHANLMPLEGGFYKELHARPVRFEAREACPS